MFLGCGSNFHHMLYYLSGARVSISLPHLNKNNSITASIKLGKTPLIDSIDNLVINDALRKVIKRTLHGLYRIAYQLTLPLSVNSRSSASINLSTDFSVLSSL